MTYTRVTATDSGTGGGPTDLTVILDDLADGLEAVEAALPGKETAGAAAAAVAAHEGAPDPHPGYATEAAVASALAGKSDTGHGHSYDPAGTAAAAVSAHEADTDPHGDRAYADGVAAAAQAAAIAASQPVDSDLTALAALSTTTFGRSLLELLDAAAARTALGLGSAALLTTGDVDERARDAIGSALVAGSGVTITPNDAGDTITIAASGGSGYSTVQDDGTSRTQRATLNFLGYGVEAVDNAGSSRTDVTIPGPFPDPTSAAAGGRYLASPLVGAAANTTLNRLYLLPLVTPWPAGRYVTQLFVQPATTVASGVTIKAALYSSAGALSKIGSDITVLAAGSTTAGVLKVANVASGSRPQFDSTKPLHFLGIVVQGAGALACGFPHQLEQLSPTPNGALPAAFGYYEDGVTGALPAVSYAPYLSQSVTNLPFHLAGVGTTA